MSSKIIAFAGSAVAEMVGRCVKISFVTHVFKQSEVADFLKVLEELRAKGLTRCVLDLSECEYISSEGLGATAQLWQWCQQHAKSAMALVLPKNHTSEVWNLFDILGISRLIGSAVCPSIDDALLYLRKFA